MSNVEQIQLPSGATAADTNEPRVPFRLFALKHGDAFIVADAYGDITGEGDGFFRDDTRVLSRFRLTLGGNAPSLLGAAVSQDNVIFTSNMTNRPLPPLGGDSTPEGVIHIARSRLLWEDRLYERLCITNYGEQKTVVPLEFEFGADFCDMFEVRGIKRQARGKKLAALKHENGVTMRYEGLDGVTRASAITFSREPDRMTWDTAKFMVVLEQRQRVDLFLEVGTLPAATEPSLGRFRAAAARARFNMRSRRRRGASLRTSGRVFNDWLDKSRADLALLTTDLPTGPYPYAGVPWFSTTFGRDAIVTALQVLWIDPALARGVLRFLAAHQAKEASPFRDATPGKIMHEIRKGEMTALGELPFGLYYGGVDTTPLFVMLACAYADRTGDLAFIDELWPALVAATAWMETDGDSDGDGFIDYATKSVRGLTNQGWKDSSDSIFHADGRFPTGPVAVVEVQGYAYAAFAGMADLASRRADTRRAAAWLTRAEQMRADVEKRFWMDETQFYGIAMDGDDKLCRVRASNAGHLLFCGLPAPERAAKVAGQLLTGPFNSGWGIRTLATEGARFNPMSYHNGSVWPHDTSLCAAGIGRYGEREGVVRILSELFEAAVAFDKRLPELYCGFPRSTGEAPIAYPVACLPQAWSSGAVFLMLQTCLGISIDGWRDEIKIDRPHLPIGIDHLSVHGLRVGQHSVDLAFRRHNDQVIVERDPSKEVGVKVSVRV